MGIKTELREVQKRLERIAGELSRLQAVLNEHFGIEEQMILRYEASTGMDNTRPEGSENAEIEPYASAGLQYQQFGQEVRKGTRKKDREIPDRDRRRVL